MQASKLQLRILALLSQQCDGTYDHASRILQAMGLPKNGAPKGYTARQCGKLTNDELIRLLPQAIEPMEEVETYEEKRQREQREYHQAKQEHKRKYEERERLNNALRAAGYQWQKMTEEDWEAYDCFPPHMPTGWVLFTPDNKPVGLDDAIKTIRWEG